MKYKILEVSEDANKNITVAVEFTDGKRNAEKTFNFEPNKTKAEILEAINAGCPIAEKTAEEIEKETALEERKAEMAGEVDKEIEIKKVKTKK